MKLIQSTYTDSPEATEACGAEFARLMTSDKTLPPFVALYGDLGVGKTAFVRGFALELAPGSAVRSPTFALVNEYKKGSRALFHFDMYRIEDEDDLSSIGFYDYLDRDGICLVEWSEKIPYALPETYLRVTLEKNDSAAPDSRRIEITLIDEDDL